MKEYFNIIMAQDRYAIFYFLGIIFSAKLVFKILFIYSKKLYAYLILDTKKRSIKAVNDSYENRGKIFYLEKRVALLESYFHERFLDKELKALWWKEVKENGKDIYEKYGACK